jgi:hypothetical protein
MQFHLRHTKSHHFAPFLQNCLLVPAGSYSKFKSSGDGWPAARRPWLKSGPVPLRPGPSQGAGRCRTTSSCPGRPLPRFWMVLLILWLCVGGAAAGTEVAANSPAVVGGAVQTGLTAACALYAASRTIFSGTKATVTVPRVVVGEDDWSGNIVASVADLSKVRNHCSLQAPSSYLSLMSCWRVTGRDGVVNTLLSRTEPIGLVGL